MLILSNNISVKYFLMKKKNINIINQSIFIYLVLLFLIVILFKNTETFYNIFKISKSNYSERLSKNYENLFYSGFCQNQSHGYLIYIKENYEFDNIPKIINFDSTKKIPYWVFEEINYKESSKYLILLNYNLVKGEEFNFTQYKILDNYKDSCFYLLKK